MKNLCTILLGILFSFLLCVSASAYTMTDITEFDTFLASTDANLNPTGDVAFAEANGGGSGLNAYKDEYFVSTDWEAVYDVTEGVGTILGYAYDTSANMLSWPTIESFIVKQGSWGPDDTYLFLNVANLRYLAVEATVGFPIMKQDDGRIWDGDVSHVTGLSGNNPVPEPATMVLFGIGLMGIAGLGRNRKKN